MPYRSRISFLEESHRALDKQTATLEKNNGDAKIIADLKKKKLAIKDEISRLNKLQFEERSRVDWDDE